MNKIVIAIFENSQGIVLSETGLLPVLSEVYGQHPHIVDLFGEAPWAGKVPGIYEVTYTVADGLVAVVDAVERIGGIEAE